MFLSTARRIYKRIFLCRLLRQLRSITGNQSRLTLDMVKAAWCDRLLPVHNNCLSMRVLTVMVVIQIALSTLQRTHQSMPKNLYFPGLPQYNRASGFSPTIIPGQSQTGRRPRNGSKNDRCEYCGKVRQTKVGDDESFFITPWLRIRNFWQLSLQSDFATVQIDDDSNEIEMGINY